MNEKFYHLPEEKQLSIINAAYKVFAKSIYKKAPMSEIAEEAQISKALLFHYFHNKLELYLYLWDNAAKITEEATTLNRVYETDDFFEMLRRSLNAKCMLMRKYSYLSLFSVNAYYEDEPEVSRKIQERIRNAKDMAIHRISQKVKADHLRKDVDFESIYREVVYASEGMLIQWYREGNNDINLFEQEYLRMIGHWEKIYKETEEYD